MPPRVEEELNPSTATVATSSVVHLTPEIVIDDDPDGTLTDDDEEDPLLRDVERLGGRRRRKSSTGGMGMRWVLLGSSALR